MASLIGKLTPTTKDGDDRKTVTRLAGGQISSTLETWNGAIRTTLFADGSFRVSIGQKGTPYDQLVEGNVDDGKRHAAVADARHYREERHAA